MSDERLKEIEARWETADGSFAVSLSNPTPALDLLEHLGEDIPWLIEQLRARNGDLISRKAAIEALREATETLSPRYDEWNMRGYRQRPSESYGEGVRDSQTLLRNLPGAAIVSESPPCPTDHAKMRIHADGEHWVRHKTPFCPDCGQSLSSVAPESAT